MKETADQRRERMTRNTRAYRARNPERVRETRQRVYWDRKRRAMEMLGGAECAECGCDELTFLEINHVGGGGCVDHRENGNTMVDRLLARQRGPEGLNVLCRVCNAVEFLTRKNPNAKGRFKIAWEGDVILARWEQFTGGKASLLSGEGAGRG